MLRTDPVLSELRDKVSRVTWSRQRRPAAERFWEKVDKNGPVPDYAPNLGPCWIWTASVDMAGYGQFGTGVGKGIIKAYRWSWEQENGPVADGLCLDHLCRVRRCVRPSHLEQVTQRENVLRGMSPMAEHARVTQCPLGHPYDEQNTILDYRGRRMCRTCKIEWDRRYYPRTRTPERIAALNARRRELYAARRAASRSG